MDMGQEFGNVRGMDAMTDGTDEFRLNSVAMEKTLPNPINKQDRTIPGSPQRHY